ncbi:beta-glucosidase [Promicromonospora sp. AC04]|uniref:glycoside hydrolase family 3 C-terminal domain-containing protein n=1 Tax=Promicromonospora sp. AC04 TaxID=2135723 RepID=UPI000D3CD33C|nr:glycoside hydrolase family 3 C-terminal domain-containing protein [Promicromonospora sp. AC04]PUB26250.1 beta-glucosidase [Promicromonospora sp. AC04]
MSIEKPIEKPIDELTPDAATPSRVFDVEHVLAGLTLEEKASLLSGLDFWTTQPVGREGVTVPGVMVTDGPHGLRKQADSPDHLGLGNSVPATCFPTAATLGSTWDPALLRRVGEALGRETRANDVAVLLGPGINIKRSPLNGRNFEYLSEDPVIAGELGAALVAGVQSQGVGTSLKHFAANNQEADRMRVSADVDERTLREIYLAGFERVVKQAQPWTVMCSYNKINDVYASQNHWLLTEVLRDEWGFEGLVMSDWGAVRDRVAAVAAGLDLEMPASGGRTDAEVVAAVRDGSLDEAVVDVAARRVLHLVARALPALDSARAAAAGPAAGPAGYDADAHHALAREAAAAGTVLLKNDGVPVGGAADSSADGAADREAAAPLLPLASGDGVAVVGELARTPRYQGAGSSQVNPTRLDDALTALRAATGADVPFAAGYTVDGADLGSGTDEAALRAQAVEVARAAGTVLVFLGLPASYESEGFDREHMDLPAEQVALLEAVAAVNPRIVVVLANGSAVSVAAWQHLAPAVVEGWLGGQAGGSGVVDVLLGAVNPAGRLAETLPLRLVDNPSYGNFPGELGHVRYGEGVLVGYRWYDARQADVAYPFGHGLSYTTFAYDGVAAEALAPGSDPAADDAAVRVRVTVTNTGELPGAEVVQVYVGDPVAQVLRPERELKAFAKVDLAPGESRELTFDLTARDLSYWHPVLRRWVVEGGEFVVSVGASSRDLRGSATVVVDGDDVRLPLAELSTVAEAIDHPVVGPQVDALVHGGAVADDMLGMIGDMPLAVVADFGMAGFDRARLATLLAEANA